MNKIILLGRLTKDPEILIGKNENKVGRFTLAVSRRYAKEGEEKITDFFNIVTFGKSAEFVEKYFGKGQQVLVLGRAELNQYEDEDGNNKTSLQIIAEELNFADGKKEDKTNNTDEFNNLYENGPIANDDELPF